MKIYIAQVDYSFEGKTEPKFVTSSEDFIKAYIEGARASHGNSAFVSECDLESGLITQYYPKPKKDVG